MLVNILLACKREINCICLCALVHILKSAQFSVEQSTNRKEQKFISRNLCHRVLKLLCDRDIVFSQANSTFTVNNFLFVSF